MSENVNESMKTYTIDGNHFEDLEGFYEEVGKLFVGDVDFTPGHNMSAFNDLLRGGFGRHAYGEPIRIRWVNYEKSREELGTETMFQIFEIVLDCEDSGHDCKLELYP